MEDNKTILIVDDEPETLKGYAEFLTPGAPTAARRTSRAEAEPVAPPPAAFPAEGYTLLLAPSGEKAVELVKAELQAGRRVAAGFYDVKLEGGMDGLATIQAIKAMDKDHRCVVVTAYQDRSVEEIHRLFGEEFKDHWDYLNKPFTQGEIVQKARQMIGAWNRDVRLQAVNKQLVRAERMAAVGQVARGVGHEFGNILLRIVGKTDLALMEDDVGKIKDHLKVVMSAAERASVIVRNLQSFSRTEPQLQSSPVKVPMEEALSLINHELGKASIEVERDFRTTSPARIDPGAMGQVFLNLLINASHAMPKGGKIRVTIENANGPDGKPGVAVHVTDSGSGIPPEVLPRIFEFAYTTKGDRGSGLGLSVSKEIVEAHGGQIQVKTQVGRGTEFIIWIPA